MNNKLQLYSISEIFQILKFSIGERLILSVPVGLRRTHTYIDKFRSRGVRISKDRKSLVLDYELNKIPFKTYLEKNSSDALVFEQIVMRKEYQCILDRLEVHKIDCATIIDAGANIGLTSLYFKAFFPNAKIYALEPSSRTFEKLKRNLSANDFTDVVAIKLGLWGRNTFLKPNPSFRDGLDWAFSLTETDQHDKGIIEVITVSELLNRYHLSAIDFFKIDIEGGEASVFGPDADVDWLKYVKVIALEIHDEFDCREEIEALLERNGFVLSHSGELTIGLNKQLIGLH